MENKLTVVSLNNKIVEGLSSDNMTEFRRQMDKLGFTFGEPISFHPYAIEKALICDGRWYISSRFTRLTRKVVSFDEVMSVKPVEPRDISKMFIFLGMGKIERHKRAKIVRDASDKAKKLKPLSKIKPSHCIHFISRFVPYVNDDMLKYIDADEVNIDVHDKSTGSIRFELHISIGMKIMCIVHTDGVINLRVDINGNLSEIPHSIDMWDMLVSMGYDVFGINNIK